MYWLRKLERYGLWQRWWELRRLHGTDSGANVRPRVGAVPLRRGAVRAASAVGDCPRGGGRSCRSLLGLLTAYLAICLTSSCTNQGGVIAVVATATPLDELRFYLGVRDPKDVGAPFVLDRGVSGFLAQVKGRSLSVRPYELFIGDPGGAPAEIQLLVLGIVRKNGVDEVPLFGFTEQPQPILGGDVLRRSVELGGWAANRRYESRGSCRSFTSPTGSFRLLPADDLDCDGVGTLDLPADCNDADPEVRPGHFEYCDGKDNACDGNPPSEVACYAVEPTDQLCRLGVRPCDEPTGGTVSGTCRIGGGPVPSAYCAAYTACEASDPLRCAHVNVGVRRFSCTLKLQEDGVTPCGSGVLDLDQPVTASACQWRIVSTGGLAATLENDAIKDQPQIEDCRPRLRVSAGTGGATSGTVVAEFFGDGRPGHVRELQVALAPSTSCDRPLECVQQ